MLFLPRGCGLLRSLGSCLGREAVGKLSPEHSALQGGRYALNSGSVSKIICQPIGDVFVYLQIIVFCL